MVLNRWKRAIWEQTIFSSEEGHVFAFPFCPYFPFVGYLLPHTKSQFLIVNTILWNSIASIPLSVAMLVIWKIYRLPLYFLLLPIVFQQIVLILLMWFLTRKFVRLPIALSIRICAVLHDQATLYDNSYRFTFGAILFSLPLAVSPTEGFWYPILICAVGLALVNWYMVYLRHHDGTASKSDTSV